MSDRQDEQQPATAGDAAATQPPSAQPVRPTDGQRWEAGVESWPASALGPDGEQRPSWEMPRESAAGPGTSVSSAAAPTETPSWLRPSWATESQEPSGQPSWEPYNAQPYEAQPGEAQPGEAQRYDAQPSVSQTAGGRPAGVKPRGGHRKTGRPAAPVALTSQTLLRQQDAVPRSRWRRFLHTATGGVYKPGLSRAETEHRDLVARVMTPVRGNHRIAVVSLKGGIGKTTTTACLGLTLAHHRGDRVVAVDANPDAGTLAERLTIGTDATVRDVLGAIDSIRTFTDISAYTSLAGRLQVLAGDQDPALSEAFSEDEYRTVADILARYFNIILTDSGTGLLHSAMSGTLAIADSLVVVGAPSVDGASRASKTLDWLIAHGHEELAARSVAVISSVRPDTGDVDMQVLRNHFTSRCRAVIEIPYDAHLVTGGLIDLERIAPSTRRAYLELAAAVADGFALPPLQRKPAAQA